MKAGAAAFSIRPPMSGMCALRSPSMLRLVPSWTGSRWTVPAGHRGSGGLDGEGALPRAVGSGRVPLVRLGDGESGTDDGLDEVRQALGGQITPGHDERTGAVLPHRHIVVKCPRVSTLALLERRVGLHRVHDLHRGVVGDRLGDPHEPTLEQPRGGEVGSRSGPEARSLAQRRECGTGATELSGDPGEFLALCGTDSVEQLLQALPFSESVRRIDPARPPRLDDDAALDDKVAPDGLVGQRPDAGRTGQHRGSERLEGRPDGVELTGGAARRLRAPGPRGLPGHRASRGQPPP